MNNFFDSIATTFERIGQTISDHPQLYVLLLVGFYLLYEAVKK